MSAPALNSSSDSTPHSGTSLNYRSDIDGLRALAVAAVVIYHAFPEYLPGGFIGVDIFFVISGFLITKIIAVAYEGNRFSFSEFYLRRVRRIFPALYLTLLGTGILAAFILLPDELEQLGKHLLGAIFFISNFVLKREAGYFDGSSEFKPLLHLWSLAIEEQYYFLFPLVLITLLNRRIKPLLALSIIALVSFALNVAVVGRHPAAAFYSPVTRIWEIMVGGALSYGYRRTVDRRSVFANLLSVLGLIAFGIALYTINRTTPFPGLAAALPVASAALFIAAGKDAYLNRLLFSSPIMTAIGRISYPLYLWHWPLLSLHYITQLNPPTVGQRLTVVALSFVLAAITYRFVETPGKRFSNRRMLSSLAVAVIACGIASSVYFFGKGLPWRLEAAGKPDSKSQMQQLAWGEPRIGTDECRKKYFGAQFCNLTNFEAPPNAALIGDSHANHFFWGLSEHYRAKGENLINLGRGGCPPFYKMDGTAQAGINYNCTNSFEDIFDFVIRTPSIRTVLLAFHHVAYLGADVRYLDKLGEITGPDNVKNTERALVRTIQALEKSGKKVILIYDLPDLKFRDVRNYVDLRPIDLRSKKSEIGDSPFVDNFRDYDAIVKEAQRVTGLKVFPTHKHLEGNFPVDARGILSYRDNTHISMNGSQIIGRHFDLD